MALVWAIMLKFIKFDDDDDGENLSATDALLKWLQFHLKDYPQVSGQGARQPSWGLVGRGWPVRGWVRLGWSLAGCFASFPSNGSAGLGAIGDHHQLDQVLPRWHGVLLPHSQVQA